MPTLPTNPHSIGDSSHVNDHNLIVSALTVLPPIGSVTAYAGSTAPSGWALCYGQEVSRTTYSTLFTALGTTFGTGNGTTTFNLPDLRGRTISGLDNMGGSDAGRLDWANTVGTTGGAQTHTLVTSEMPSHSHTTYVNTSLVNARTAGSAGYNVDTGGAQATGNTGGGGAHNNMQPTMLLNWIIRID